MVDDDDDNDDDDDAGRRSMGIVNFIAHPYFSVFRS